MNTEECEADAKSVVGLVCLNTENGTADEKSVMGLVCVNTEDSAAYTKSVVDLVYKCEHGRVRSRGRECGGFSLQL